MLSLIKSLYVVYKRGISYEKVKEYDYLLLEKTNEFVKSNFILPSISSIKLDVVEYQDKVKITLFYHTSPSKSYILKPNEKYENIFSLKRWKNIKDLFKVLKKQKIEVVIQYDKEKYIILFPQKRKDK